MINSEVKFKKIKNYIPMYVSFCCYDKADKVEADFHKRVEMV